MSDATIEIITYTDSSINEKEWYFLRDSVIKKYNIQTVLEFGPGLSTKLMLRHVESIITYENFDQFFEVAEKELKGTKADLRKWDGKIVHEELGEYDLVFVDGPPGGGIGRRYSVEIASKHGQFIVVHDGDRKRELKLQAEFLPEKYSFIDREDRCMVWARKDIQGMEKDKIGYDKYGIYIGDQELSLRK